jgi:uncharacterized protein (DUF1697 family)
VPRELKTYVALLRGINVGGNNIIKMAALAAAFEALGFRDVKTFIQSGNVVFDASEGKVALTKKIEAALDAAFGYAPSVVVLSSTDLGAVVKEAPRGFGDDPARYRHDVLFVKPPLTTRAALPEIEVAPGTDEVHAGTHALYFRRRIATASKSRLPKLVQRPIYKSLTIRNWNTTQKLHALAAERT